MAEVPRGLIDSLNRDVSGLAGNARGAFERRFADMLPGFLDEAALVPPERVAALRDAAVELRDEVAGAAAEASCARGAMFYDEARTACAGKALGHSPSPHRRAEYDDDAIRGMIDSVAETGNPSAFAEGCAQRVDYSVRKACGDAAADCGRADPLKPKFARVPAGAETCSFCIMLASRGAVYANALTAGATKHYHPNCDCKIVPDFGRGIEGYDPDKYFELWKSDVLKEEESIRRTINRQWAEFRKYDTEEAYFETVGKYIRSFSKDGLIDCEFQAKPLAKELMTAKTLAKNGHRVRFLPTNGGYGEKNPDCILGDGFIYDFKRIESSNPNKVFQNIKRSSEQCGRFVIDLVISRMSDKDALASAADAVASSETSAVEVLILHADGSEELV